MAAVYDDIKVINLGLGKIAANRVRSINPPKSPIEIHVANGYRTWRNSELTKRRWAVANRSADLTQAPTTDTDNPAQTPMNLHPNDGRIYRYKLPGDCLVAIRQKHSTWVQRGTFLYSSATTLWIEYTADILESTFTDPLADLIACRIAMECVEFATQSNTKAVSADTLYKLSLADAGRANAIILDPVNSATPDDLDDWQIARETGYIV